MSLVLCYGVLVSKILNLDLITAKSMKLYENWTAKKDAKEMIQPLKQR